MFPKIFRKIATKFLSNFHQCFEIVIATVGYVMGGHTGLERGRATDIAADFAEFIICVNRFTKTLLPSLELL